MLKHFTIAIVILLGQIFMNAHGEDSEHPLKVMTYNVRYAADDPPNSWQERRPVGLAMLHETRPHVIGMQEALYRQVKDFQAGLPDYDWIGLGREGGSRGEFMAVFYQPARLEPLEFDHFWLSDTPEVINSSTWGNSNRRMVTWIKFLDRESGKPFFFINTHFDHRIEDARSRSAHLIRERMLPIVGELPAILLGDFNVIAQEDQAVYQALVAEDAFEDIWRTAAERGEAYHTFHGYRSPIPGDRRIDWILTRGPIEAQRIEIVTFQRDGQFPSDHFPVLATVSIGE